MKHNIQIQEWKGLIHAVFSGDTLIAVADGRNAITIKELADSDKDVPVYSMDPISGEVTIKWGRKPRITGENQKLMRITLDNNTFLDVTPFHKFLYNG